MRYLKISDENSDSIKYVLLDIGAMFNFFRRGKGFYLIGISTADKFVDLSNNKAIKVNPDNFMTVISDIPDGKIVDVDEVLKTAGEYEIS
jgi:hypothetical protein